MAARSTCGCCRLNVSILLPFPRRISRWPSTLCKRVKAGLNNVNVSHFALAHTWSRGQHHLFLVPPSFHPFLLPEPTVIISILILLSPPSHCSAGVLAATNDTVRAPLSAEPVTSGHICYIFISWTLPYGSVPLCQDPARVLREEADRLSDCGGTERRK